MRKCLKQRKVMGTKNKLQSQLEKSVLGGDDDVTKQLEDLAKGNVS